MSELDVIRDTAQQLLIVPTLSGEKDNFLLDRTQRIVRNVEHICRLPELTANNLLIDRFCLIAAAWFSDTGFAKYLDEQDLSSRIVLSDITAADIRDFSTQIVNDKLSGALNGQKIDKIDKIIIESSNRFTNMTEAMVLSDARNLDDIGAVGIFNEFRRYVVHGRGVADVLQSWKRKIDYQYWQARLKEGFRFDSVRQLAQQRFEAAQFFMNHLSDENNAKDIEELILETL